MLDAVLHRLDVGLPVLLGHGDDHVYGYQTTLQLGASVRSGKVPSSGIYCDDRVEIAT